jgi:hypothetical protein
MTILCAVQELFLPTSGYLNFKRRLQSVFKYVPRYAAIRGPCQFSNARLIPMQFAVRTSCVTTSPFTHRLRNQINGLSSGTKMCLSAVIFNI